MQRRALGSTGLSVGRLALGGNVFGWTADERRSFELLDKFVSAGLNLIDTADVYSSWVEGHVGGESEKIIGRWLRESGRRDEVLIATKVGMDTAERTGGLARSYILKSVEGSLRRLQTDHIDLYQAHTDDTNTPFAETLGAFRELLQDGRVRAIGASNYTAARLLEAAHVSESEGLPRYGALQPRYNLYDRADYETELASVSSRLGLGVIPYASLASGFLSGKYRSRADLGKSVRGRRVESRLNPRGERILDALGAVAREEQSTHAAVAIAWLLTRPTVTAPIASATSLQQLEELIEGTMLRLSQDSIRQLDTASVY